MYIDIGERIAGKQDGPGPIIYGPPRAPRIAKNAHLLYCVPLYFTNSRDLYIGLGLSHVNQCFFFPKKFNQIISFFNR